MPLNALPVVLLFVLSLCFCGCRKSAETGTPSSPRPEAPANSRGLEACSLITKEEVGAIQHATILTTQSNETHDGAYLISLCYYSSREVNMSVSFALTQADPSNPAGSDPFDNWKQTFGRYRGGGETNEPEVEKGKGEKREEEQAPPKRIEGVGEEAFWSGNRFGGALYVLRKNLILRISVGGGEDAETKIARSKALAEKAISRL